MSVTEASPRLSYECPRCFTHRDFSVLLSYCLERRSKAVTIYATDPRYELYMTLSMAISANVDIADPNFVQCECSFSLQCLDIFLQVC